MPRFVVAGTGLPEIISLIEDIIYADETFEFLGFVDDNPLNKNRQLYGYEFIGTFEALRNMGDVFVANSIGRSTEVRWQSTARLISLGAKFINLIHPGIKLRGVELGNGNVVFQDTIIH